MTIRHKEEAKAPATKAPKAARRPIRPFDTVPETRVPGAPVQPDAPPEAHPLCLLLPDMDSVDFENLKSDIAANGQRRPVLLHEGKILDGRHRARACEELDIVTRYEEWSGTDPLSFVLSENLHRRHLTASQKAMIAAKFMAPYQEAATARQKAGSVHREVTLGSREPKVTETGRSAALAGAAAGVSRESIKRALKIAKEGTQEDEREVLEGRVTVNAKAREIAARNPKTTKPKRKPAPPSDQTDPVTETAPAVPAPADQTPTPETTPADPPDDSINRPLVLEFTDREWARLREAAGRWHYPVRSFVRALLFVALDREDEDHEALTRGAR